MWTMLVIILPPVINDFPGVNDIAEPVLKLVAPFGTMTKKNEQHYYVSMLSSRQWPSIEAFIAWLKSRA